MSAPTLTSHADLEAAADAWLAAADAAEDTNIADAADTFDTPAPARKIEKSPARIVVNGVEIDKRNVRFEGPAVALYQQWTQENETAKACSGSSNPAFINPQATAAEKTAALTMCLGDDNTPACPLLSACAFWAETAFKDLEGIMAGRVMQGEDEDDTETDEAADFDTIISSLRRTQAAIEAEQNTVTDDLLAEFDFENPYTVTPAATEAVTIEVTDTKVRYSGPARSVTTHIAQVFANLPVGTFLKVSEIVNATSAEYGDDKPSSGAVTSQMKSKNFNLTGLQVATTGTKGITKTA